MLDLDEIGKTNLPTLDPNESIPCSHALIYTDWTVTEAHFVGGASLKENPEQLRARETIFTIGNGYLGTRGSFEEGYPQALPATLIHGVYDDVAVIYTELANCPDWLSLLINIDGERFRLDRGEILHYERQLDLRDGVLSRVVRWCSPTGKTVELRFERFASLADLHVLALRCQITPLDFNGTIAVQSSLNGYPENYGFDHWEQLDQGTIAQGLDQKLDQGIWLQARTRSTHIELGMASKMTVMDTDVSVFIYSRKIYGHVWHDHARQQAKKQLNNWFH